MDYNELFMESPDIYPEDIGQGNVKSEREDESAVVPASAFAVQQSVKPEPGRVIRNAGDATFNDRKIFVGGLNYEVTDEILKSFFEEKYGTVDSAEVMKDRNTNMSRGFGFVVFADMAHVEEAVAHGRFECFGNMVDIRRAQPKGSQSKAAAQNTVHSSTAQPDNLQGKIFIGGIDPDTNQETIYQYFSKFGEIKSIDMMDQKAHKRGFCFLTFTKHETAIRCTGRHPDIGRFCEVKLAVPRPEKRMVQHSATSNTVSSAHKPIPPSQPADRMISERAIQFELKHLMSQEANKETAPKFCYYEGLSNKMLCNLSQMLGIMKPR